MYLPDFDYYAPDSVAEACKLLSQFGARAKVLAGGTDLIPKMKHALMHRKFLISIKKIPGLEKNRICTRKRCGDWSDLNP